MILLTLATNGVQVTVTGDDGWYAFGVCRVWCEEDGQITRKPLTNADGFRDEAECRREAIAAFRRLTGWDYGDILTEALTQALRREWIRQPAPTISEAMARLECDMRADGIAEPLADHPELGRVWCDLCSLAGETPPTRVLRSVEAVRREEEQ